MKFPKVTKPEITTTKVASAIKNLTDLKNKIPADVRAAVLERIVIARDTIVKVKIADVPELDTRTRNILFKNGFKYLNDVKNYPDEKLKEIAGIGVHSYTLIQRSFEAQGWESSLKN